MDVDQLPTYDPRSDVAKKEALDASRADLARALVHLIPVGVLLCGLLLWSFSDTDFPAGNTSNDYFMLILLGMMKHVHANATEHYAARTQRRQIQIQPIGGLDACGHGGRPRYRSHRYWMPRTQPPPEIKVTHGPQDPKIRTCVFVERTRRNARGRPYFI
ncbi:hypothetical protein Zm00014a_039613 [Zea mays]|uniref:Uncharacterized protein n=1 Tax=Zea mays TaxID=4577 RepID=A0A3L6FK64_MAIZE|nr:hypothetical protein Zm00014a_039613 [Zea mays]